MKVLEYENFIFFEAENLISSMIDNVTNTSLEFEVYGDEMTSEERRDLQENMRGYAAAIKVLIDAYSELTPLAERKDFMISLSDQIVKILEAPRVAYL